MARTPLIEVRDVAKTFARGDEEVRVLDHLSTEIGRGEYVALMGPSGSGKTTLLNLLGALDRPDSGAILVAGEDITTFGDDELASWRARAVGFIFQAYNLLPVLKAVENVELPLLLFGLSRKERRRRALLALDLVGLADRVDHYPRELSGGQEQRVAIARALVTDPAFLLADEPTGDLDPQSSVAILDLLDRLHRDLGKTIVMVTHARDAADRAERIVHLEGGRVVAGGI
ncbi:MAG: ABC transporter ATP-binding protein [Planctomycetota bacterium]|nr:ABC transporter ATP-binding protein [Planctomycetota bacterium]MDA0934488.1 ABC transporter ATP-binding protein [Planctomycetota bacterium]MDA1222981.1 ABC transporter ATP-binding protein [Planctomycetota bacterium]